MTTLRRALPLCAALTSACIDFSLPTSAALDLEPPEVRNVVRSPASAHLGDSVVLSFEVSEPLAEPAAGAPNPSVSLAGFPMTCIGSGLSYRCAVTVLGLMPEGSASFHVVATDLWGNRTELDVLEPVLLDFTAPALELGIASTELPGGAVTTFTVTASEDLRALPHAQSELASGPIACVGAMPGKSFTCTLSALSATSGPLRGSLTVSGEDLAGNEGRSAPLELTVREGTPTLELGGVTPNPVKLGDEVTIAFSSSVTLTGCSAFVSGVAAACAFASDRSCVCNLRVTPVIPEGEVLVQLSVRNGAGEQSATTSLVVDRQPPAVALGSVAMARAPVGEDDAVVLGPDALAERGPQYEGRRAVLVRLFEDALGLREIGSAVPVPGEAITIPLPDTSALAPARVWISAVDVPGNESAPEEILSGAGSSGPAVSAAALALLRRPLGEQDAVQGQPGALAASPCAPAAVRVHDLASGGELLGSAAVEPDGSFAPIALGTDQAAPATVFVSCLDKCGLESPRFEPGQGRASPPEVVAGALLEIVRRPLGVSDAVRAAAGAFGATCALKTAALLDSPGGATLATVSFAAGGSLPETEVGTPDAAPPRVFVAASDKCGLVSAPAEVVQGPDHAPPVVDPSLLVIERRPVGAPDSLAAQQGAVADATSAVREVRLHDAEVAGDRLATVVPAADGSIASVQVGSADAAPASVWASAVDKAGNQTFPVEVLAGKGLPPLFDQARLRLERRPVGALDSVLGDPGALTSVCAAKQVQVLDAAAGGAELGHSAVAADGSIAELPVGTASQAPREAWLLVQDKCGNLVGPVAAQGADHEPPQIDAALLTLRLNPTGEEETLSGAAGALVDATSAIREARVFDAPEQGSALSPPSTPEPDGSLAELSLGDVDREQVYVEATDKCGNASRVLARHVVAAFGLAGRSARSLSGNQAAAYGFACDFEPCRPYAGYPSVLVDEAAPEPLAAEDGLPLTVTAGYAPEAAEGWTELPTAPVRTEAAIGFDSEVGRLVVFGGRERTGSAARATAQTWELGPDRWSWLAAGPADPRPPAAAAVGGYDPVHELFLAYLFERAELWAYDRVAWVKRASPTGCRVKPAAAVDPVDGKLYVLGGDTEAATLEPGRTLCVYDPATDTWSYRVASDPVPSRRAAGMALDLERRKLVVFGGTARRTLAESGVLSNDTWEYDLASQTWAEVSTATRPSIRHRLALAYDPVRHRTVLYGGIDSSKASSETWEYDGASWTQSGATGPGPRYAHMLAYDAGAQAVVLVGDGPPLFSPMVPYPPDRVSTWAFDGTSWTERAQVLGGRTSAKTTWDAARGKLVLYGGYTTSIQNLNTTNQLFFDTWERDADRWRRVSATATGGGSLAYDPRRGRTLRSDGGRVWELEGGAWSEVPLALPRATMAGQLWFDAARRGLYYTSSGCSLYRVDEQGFTQVPTAPSAGQACQFGAGLAPDPARGRLLVYGLDQGWSLAGTSWSRLESSAPGRAYLPVAVDPTRAELSFLLGTYDFSAHFVSDQWRWGGGGWEQVSAAVVLRERLLHFLAYDLARGRLRTGLGLDSGAGYPDDEWEYAHQVPHARVAAAQVVFPVNEQASFASLFATVTAGAQGEGGSGLDLFAWSWATESWVAVAGHDGAAPAPASGALPGATADYTRHGALWLQVVARHRSGAGGPESELLLDHLGLSGDYLLPAEQ